MSNPGALSSKRVQNFEIYGRLGLLLPRYDIWGFICGPESGGGRFQGAHIGRLKRIRGTPRASL